MGDGMKSYPVRQVFHHGDDLVTLRFDAPWEAEPGQFAFLWIPGLTERPFSVGGVNADGTMDFTILALGGFTRACLDVQVGDVLGVRGPFGSTFSTEGRRPLLVGGGTGIAPMRYLAQQLAAQGREFDMVLGARDAEHHFFVEELRELGAVFCTDNGSLGQQGFVTGPMADLLGRAEVVCACGPEAMLLAVKELAQGAGVPVQLSFERYMKCGLGICGQCCMDGSGIRLCVEGPVLDDALLAGTTELGLPHRGPTGTRPA